MAEIIRKAVNKFTKGLIMDFSPENTKNDTLTHALNATLLTFNGNELSLQNDMGNARVETAYLPEGYIPVGTCEYGGIIYIVSYNPLEDKSQIGCFPSPERNVSNDELGELNATLNNTDFQKNVESYSGELLNSSKLVLLKHDSLNPGDKFIICANDDLYKESLKDLLKDSKPITNPRIALNVVSIEDSGKITYLNSDLRSYNTGNGTYHILGTKEPNNQESVKKDIDDYRNVLSSGYNVFRSKTSGKLAILAELVMIDSFSLTHNVIPKTFTKYEGDSAEEMVDPGYFDVVLYSDIAPQVTTENFNTVPKLRYYYLKESQGYLTCGSTEKTLFTDNGAYDSVFFNTTLSEIYTLPEGVKNSALGNSGQFGFPKANTYHGNMLPANLGEENSYTRFKGGQYHLVSKSQITANTTYFYNTLNASIYKYETEGEYKEVIGDASISDGNTYYVKSTSVEYLNANLSDEHKDKPLYKKSDAVKAASKEIIENTSITKYVYIQSDEYLQITYDPNNPDHKGPFYTKTSEGGKDVYTEVSVKEGDTCYMKTHKTVLESIGNQISGISKYGIIYYKDGEEYLGASQEEIKDYWDRNSNLTLYYANKTEDFKEATQEQVLNYDLLGLTLYYKDHYVKVDSNMIGHTSDRLYIKVMSDAYVPKSVFSPTTTDNYIEGKSAPNVNPTGEPISIHKIGDFLVTDDYMEYKDLCLASLKIPPVIFKRSSQDFPFKYSYTIVPCMDYGKLDHLAVSNTVNFNNLRAFSKSNFTTWKYHIDGNQLRLTFGAEVFDTFETTKVDGLILEFYDLWGFAGSLEISNKKAYSGLYTKIIPLNTLGVLSKKKIHSNCKERHENYQRNINIQTVENTFQINGKLAGYVNDEEGWRFEGDVENDCGTLSSNLIYGVKTYLRRTSGKIGSDTYKEEYIPKKEFFLYTLPIYNDLYYSISDFSTLEDPELDLVLTYKLSDSSTKRVYIEDSKLPQGYCDNDSQMIKKYMGGVYSNESLSAIKYYKYSGKSELYLEVGLKEEYGKIGLSYDPSLNDYFKCDLQLLSDTNEAFSVKSSNDSEGLLNVTEYLNYNNSSQVPISLNINKLGFFDGQNYKTTYPVTSTTPYNFINNTPNTYVDLRYEFVVGHKFVINNIKPKAVPMPVLCALLHQNDLGNYNYSDFNMTPITSTQDDVEVTNIYSDFIYYNSLYGTTEEYKAMFGVCRQVPEGTLTGTKSVTLSLEVDLEKTSIPGKYNSGEILKQAQTKLGKLSFCSPHAHGVNGINDGKVTNIESDHNTLGYSIPPTACDLCNLALNTFNSVNYNSEFISTTDGRINDTGDKRVFVGLSNTTLTKFNNCLMETMKNIYAYNPDYNSHLISTGDISLVDNAVQFTSNVISTNAALTLPEGSVFNDFICIGTIFVSKYLEYLTRYSNIRTLDFEGKPLKQVNFVPNYNFCGNAPEYYLVSTLTYNIPYPVELLEELSFSASDMFAVKHHEGTSEVMFGTPNQKTLYGYIKNHIQPLDVSNYKIESDGTLTVKEPSISESFWWSHSTNTDSSAQSSSGGLTTLPGFSGSVILGKGVLMSVPVQATCYGYETGTSSVPFMAQVSLGHSVVNSNDYVSFDDAKIWRDKNSIFVYTTNYELQCKISEGNNHSSIFPDTIVRQGYKHYVTPIGMSCGGKIANLTGAYLNILNNADISTIRTIVNGDNKEFVQNGGTHIEISQIRSSCSDLISMSYANKDITIESGFKTSGHYLFELNISALHFTIRRISYLQHVQGYILPTVSTSDYATTAYNTYEIKTAYEGSRFKYTTLTVNDLMYEPNVSGHRLYVKNNNIVNNPNPSNLIYYRAKSGKWDSTYNVLHLFTGPCFINTP